MKRNFNEIVDYEIKRIQADRNLQNQFFGKAIAIQRSPKTYAVDYAKRKLLISCAVLCMCGYCNNKKCENCKLECAHKIALAEIEAGTRKPPVFS